jgi:SAM-dependent methyltransferase
MVSHRRIKMKATKKSFIEYSRKLEEFDQEIRMSLSASHSYQHDRRQESYPYIPYDAVENLWDVFQFILYEKKFYGMKYVEFDLIDIGAGTGRIVALAKYVGLSAVGLEYHAPYVELGRKYMELSEEELLVGDAFQIEKEFLQKISNIYTYMPLHNHARMTELHFSLFLKARPSANFLEMLPIYHPMNMAKFLGKSVEKFPGMHIGVVTKSHYYDF